MARPRKVTDEQLLAASARAIGLYGPDFTLAHVATEAGVAVGTVAGRFGSKRELLRELMVVGTAEVERRMTEAAAACDDPVDAVIAAATSVTGGLVDPRTAVHHLAQLGYDLVDPVLRDGYAAQRATVCRVFARLFRRAALPGAPSPNAAARIVAALVNGALLDWSLAPRGTFARSLRADLDAVVDAWRAP